MSCSCPPPPLRLSPSARIRLILVQMYLEDIFTVPGQSGGAARHQHSRGQETPAGLPLGLQIVGPRLGDEMVLRVAAQAERAAGHASMA